MIEYQKKESSKRMEQIEDVVKTLLCWVVVTALFFAWWMLVLLLFSLFLMNIWRTSMEQLLRYGIALTVATGIVYGAILVRRKLR